MVAVDILGGAIDLGGARGPLGPRAGFGHHPGFWAVLGGGEGNSRNTPDTPPNFGNLRAAARTWTYRFAELSRPPPVLSKMIFDPQKAVFGQILKSDFGVL